LTAPFIGAVADVLGRKRVIAAAMLAVVVPLGGAILLAIEKIEHFGFVLPKSE